MKSAPGHLAATPARRLVLLVSCLALVLFPACGPSVSQDAPPHVSTSPTSPEDTAAAPGEDIWDVFYLQDSKIGYGRTTERPVTRDGRQRIEVESLNHLEITRFGQKSQQDVKMSTLETPEGQLLSFTTEATFGPSPTVVRGEVEGGEMVITTETQGRRGTNRIPWPADVHGFRAVEQSLARHPLQPGQSRSLKMLVPLVNQVAEVTLEARDFETTPVLGLETRLLRIESAARLPGDQSIDMTLWTDAQGEVIKTLMPALAQTSYRTTRALAAAPAADKGKLDLGFDLFVKVDPPLERPHQTHRVRYRVELADGDPAKAFASGPTQSVRSLGPHTAEITVRSIRPDKLAPSEHPAPPLGPEFTTANSVLQIDDPRIQKMAAEAKGDAKQPAEVAMAT